MAVEGLKVSHCAPSACSDEVPAAVYIRIITTKHWEKIGHEWIYVGGRTEDKPAILPKTGIMVSDFVEYIIWWVSF